VGGKIFVVGGNFNFMYDPIADAWTEKTPPPVPVWKYASVVMGHFWFLFGSVSSENSYSWTNIAQVYFAQNDSWSFKQHLPEVFVDPVAEKISGIDAPLLTYVFGWPKKLFYLLNRLHSSRIGRVLGWIEIGESSGYG
jgi:hypothetical protein